VKILQAERERKELSGIRKLAKDRAKKSNLHNKKLRDCRAFAHKMRDNFTSFITEGDLLRDRLPNRKCNISRFSLRGALNSTG
jgi:topoisomerase-4 subunit B